MNLDYLKEFLSLTETLNYQETAEIMHVSPSALSKHIMRLENDLGVNLFDRSTRTVTLNGYGEIVRENARQIIEIMDRCANQLREKMNSDTYSLKIGYLPVYEEFSLHEIVATFAKDYPHIDVSMSEISGPVSEVDYSMYDYLFLDEVPQQKNLQNYFLIEDCLVLIVAKEHPLANRESVSLSELKNEKFIAHGQDSSSICRDYIVFEKECTKEGFKPNNVFYSHHVGTIVKLVNKNVGIAILNTNSLSYYARDAVVVVPLEHKISTRLYCVKTSTDPAKEKDHGLFKEYVMMNYSQLAPQSAD